MRIIHPWQLFICAQIVKDGDLILAAIAYNNAGLNNALWCVRLRWQVKARNGRVRRYDRVAFGHFCCSILSFDVGFRKAKVLRVCPIGLCFQSAVCIVSSFCVESAFFWLKSFHFFVWRCTILKSSFCFIYVQNYCLILKIYNCMVNSVILDQFDFEICSQCLMKILIFDSI